MTSLENKRKLAKAIYTREQKAKLKPLDFFRPIDFPELKQKDFLESTKKDESIFGGNRSSKTVSGTIKVLKYCLDNPNADCWAATWADLSVPILQREYFRWLPKDGSVKYAMFTEQRGFSNRIIIFKNRSKIRFKTYDQGRESFQGAAKHIIHLDEEPPQEIVSECKARLIDKNGSLLRTLTPLRGITYTYDDVVLNEMNDPEVAYWFFDSRFNPHINQTAQKRIISSFPGKEAEVRQTGHFLNLTTGNAYYPFSEENIIDSFGYMKFRPLLISCDFNVDLQCWSISQQKENKDYIFDFVELEHQANTQLMCDMIKSKYPEHQGGVQFYGDVSGSARSPATSKTNWAIIRESFPNASIDYQNIRNIKDRVDALNGRLKNAEGVHLYITKKCKRLIKDLRQVTWEMLLNKGKAGKLTHSSDALSYQMFWLYPLTAKKRSKQW